MQIETFNLFTGRLIDFLCIIADGRWPKPCIVPAFFFWFSPSADLHQIIRSGQALTNEHVQYFSYQILRGATTSRHPNSQLIEFKGWNSSTLLGSYIGTSNREISSWTPIVNLKFVILAWVGVLIPCQMRMLHTWRNMSQLDGTGLLKLCLRIGEIFEGMIPLLFLT